MYAEERERVQKARMQVPNIPPAMPSTSRASVQVGEWVLETFYDHLPHRWWLRTTARTQVTVLSSARVAIVRRRSQRGPALR